MTMTEEKPAPCCGQTGTRNLMWLYTRDLDETAAIIAEADLGPLPFSAWAPRPEHVPPPPTEMHRETLRGAFCGEGLRLVVEGCNRKWPHARPTAVLVCAECGRGRSLEGKAPRGWVEGNRRWRAYLLGRGVYLKRYRTAATVYDGLVAYIAEEGIAQ